MANTVTRRVFLGHAAGAVTAVALVSSCTGEAEAADPIFDAIERHRSARAHLNELDSDDDERWIAADTAELQAWGDLVITHPTTLAGLAAFSGHVSRHPDLKYMANADGAASALTTIACCAARLIANGRA